MHTHEVESAGPFLESVCKPGADRRPEERSAPSHLAQRGPDELLEGHHCGYRIAGQAEYERAIGGFEATKGHRVTRFHIHAPEEQRTSEFLEYAAHVIPAADRNAR